MMWRNACADNDVPRKGLTSKFSGTHNDEPPRSPRCYAGFAVKYPASSYWPRPSDSISAVPGDFHHKHRSALKFKPQIFLNNGCHPYPVVNTAGDTDGGRVPPLRVAEAPAMTYGPLVWYNGNENPDVLVMTPSAHSGYSTYAPPDADMVDGTSCKVEYTSSWLFIDHHLEGTSTAGETQDLIMWDDMTDAARNALSTTDFGNANVPMKDGNFLPKLAKAYPL